MTRNRKGLFNDLDGRIDTEQANDLAKQYPNMSYLGNGNAGIAYEHQNPNTVVKVTRDGLEAERAKELIGKVIPCCVQCFNVKEVGRGAWSIETEKVQPLSSDEKKLFDHIYNLEWSTEQQHLMSDYVAKYGVTKYRQAKAEFTELCRCLRQHGVSDEDAAGVNLGRRNGKLILLDLG